jgi:hypothetical protein
VTARRLLCGGLVADGVGPVPAAADVLVEDDVIVSVGLDAGGGVDAERVDLPAGSVACPGFIGGRPADTERRGAGLARHDPLAGLLGPGRPSRRQLPALPGTI